MSQPAGRELDELSLWLVGSRRLGEGLASAVDVELVTSGGAGPPDDRRRPDVLVVEAAERPTAEHAGLDELLARCEQAGVPTVLWVTTDRFETSWLDVCGRVDRVFAPARAALDRLEAAGAVAPTVLWAAATALPVDARPAAAPAGRPDPVVWLGGWRSDWPAEWRERLEAVLRGLAGHGLRIVRDAPIDGLPPDLRPYVVADAELDRESALRRAKVVLAADGVLGSPLDAPAVAFDAIACGAAAITPHDFASLHDFAVGGTPGAPWRNLIPVVHSGDAADREVGELLADDELRAEVVSHSRRIVANNHTYGHRVATLASAVGYRVLPRAT